MFDVTMSSNDHFSYLFFNFRELRVGRKNKAELKTQPSKQNSEIWFGFNFKILPIAEISISKITFSQIINFLPPNHFLLQFQSLISIFYLFFAQ